jgi:nucleoside-diphosphate-sugar epimerase
VRPKLLGEGGVSAQPVPAHLKHFCCPTKMKILVTGANGFLGESLIYSLIENGHSVLGSVRQLRAVENAIPAVSVGQIDAETDWQHAVGNCEAVIHTAARVHIQSSHDSPADQHLFDSINVDGTLNLASQAAAYGVKRFIFISTIKVNGERTTLGHPYRATDVPNPQDPYGVSKFKAEIGLRQIAQQTGMEVVIIRPPLIYGRGVKGNFQTMLRFVKNRIPLPFGCIESNRRSFVGLDNLISLITICLSHPSAANNTFLVSDNEDVSTAELIKKLGKAINKPPVLIPISLNYLNRMLGLLGKSHTFEKIAGTLQVDISATYEQLDWRPIISLDEGLALMVSEGDE